MSESDIVINKEGQAELYVLCIWQTKLHDGICAKRQAATIATHDLEAIKWPLTFDARNPADIKV